MRKLLVAVLVASSISTWFSGWYPAPEAEASIIVMIDGPMFDDLAALDATEVRDLRPVRPDFERAYAECQLSGFSNLDCWDSVRDGEF